MQASYSLEEITGKFSELGSAWNTHQIALFLELLPGVGQKKGRWQAQESGKEQTILEAIEQKLVDKPVVPIQSILNGSLLRNLETTAEEILQIAIRSGRYASPNNKVIKRL